MDTVIVAYFEQDSDCTHINEAMIADLCVNDSSSVWMLIHWG